MTRMLRGGAKDAGPVMEGSHKLQPRDIFCPFISIYLFIYLLIHLFICIFIYINPYAYLLHRFILALLRSWVYSSNAKNQRSPRSKNPFFHHLFSFVPHADRSF
jgi:hypothetical protein